MKNFLSYDEFQNALSKIVGDDKRFSGYLGEIFNLLKDVDLRLTFDPNKDFEGGVSFVVVDKGLGMYHGEISVQSTSAYICINFSKKSENLKVIIAKESFGGYDITSTYEFHEPSTNHNDDFKNLEIINKEFRFEEILDNRGRVKALNFYSKEPAFEKLSRSNYSVSNQKGKSLTLTIDYENPKSPAVLDYEILDQSNNMIINGKNEISIIDNADLIKGVKFTKKRNYSQNPINNSIECNVEKWMSEKIETSLNFNKPHQLEN